MIEKTVKINKKNNINNKAIEKDIKQAVEEQIEKVKKNSEKSIAKVHAVIKETEEIPYAMQDISNCLINMQQGLFAANMALYTKSLTCYSLHEIINLSQDYFNNVIKCCLNEGAKISNKLVSSNNTINKI